MDRKPGFLRTAVSAMLLMLWAQTAAAADLLMVERKGCTYCERWHKEIGPIYPKTDVGAAAPLRVIQQNALKDSEIALKRPVIFTPTFVLLDNDTEIDRLEGYPSEDFFWPLIEQMMIRQGQTTVTTASNGGS